MVGASLVLLIPSTFGYAPRQQFAQLGDFRLESGATIREAFIGYRTLGRLNASRSNAVLVAPWYQGTTWQLAHQIGPGKLVDSSKYFVILVDTLGNGVSSSPSNSATQPGVSFPQFTIADMVESQHQLLTRVLGISHLHAVVGISMGGMQVFEWMTRHPGFMHKGVSIVGSPQAQQSDQENCAGIIRVASEPAWPRIREAVWQFKPRTALNELRSNPHNQILQARAIASLDIARAFDGSMARAAESLRAELMVVGTWQDRDVNPRPGFDFARLANARVLELDGRCGHQAPSCERATMWPAIASFLDARS
jgi:homoserine O-acetyltransferase